MVTAESDSNSDNAKTTSKTASHLCKKSQKKVPSNKAFVKKQVNRQKSLKDSQEKLINKFKISYSQSAPSHTVTSNEKHDLVRNILCY